MQEYQWALQQARVAHGQVRKWVIYAREQLEIAGYPKQNISTKLRKDLPDFSSDYITQICSKMGWTDSRYSPIEQEEPPSDVDSGTGNETVEILAENRPYIEHLQSKIDLLH